jgi:hypothetical protein
MWKKQGKNVKETHYKKRIGFRLTSRFHISNNLLKNAFPRTQTQQQQQFLLLLNLQSSSYTPK